MLTPDEIAVCIIPADQWGQMKPPRELLLKVQQLLEEGRPASPAYHPNYGWFVVVEPPIEEESN